MNDSFALSNNHKQRRLRDLFRCTECGYLPVFGGGGGFGRTITTGGPPQ